MATDPTPRYPTLRRTRTALRALAPIASTAALLVGLSLFAGVAPRILGIGYSVSERIIWGTVGLGYLIGAPVVSFVLFFLLRAGADLIDLWIDQQVAADKSADLIERQLVPATLRMCQALDQVNESLARAREPSVPAASAADPAAESRQRAADAVRDAIRREAWDKARQLAATLREQFPGPQAPALDAEIDAARDRNVQALRQQLDQAERDSDADAMLNARDRLSGYLDGTELYQVDRRVAHWTAGFLREALAAGQAGQVIHLAERIVDSVGQSTAEGAQIRAALPTIRRSAGRCPECGEPYDVSLVRCGDCESKRAARSAAPAKRSRK